MWLHIPEISAFGKKLEESSRQVEAIRDTVPQNNKISGGHVIPWLIFKLALKGHRVAGLSAGQV